MMTFKKILFALLITLACLAVYGSESEANHTSCQWQIIPSKQKIRFSAIQFMNARIAFGHDQKCFWATQDGGRHWKKLYCAMPLQKEPEKLTFFNTTKLGNFNFINTTEGWMLEGDNQLLHTRDSGITWVRRVFNKNTWFKKVYFFNHQHGWLLGSQILPNKIPDVRGIIYATTDGGKNWVELDTGISVNYRWRLRDIRALSATDIWIVGDFLLHSVNGGKTWQSPSIDSSLVYDLNNLSIQFTDNDIGWIRRLPAKNYLFTHDGGKTWIPRQHPTQLGFMDSLIFVSSTEAWATAGGMYHTIDGGESWRLVLGKEAYMSDESIYYILHQYLESDDLLIATNKTDIMFCVKRR